MEEQRRGKHEAYIISVSGKSPKELFKTLSQKSAPKPHFFS